MNRRNFLGAVSGGALLTGLSGPVLAAGQGHPAPAPQRPPVGNASPDQPNVLIIISDQHRPDVSKRNGYPLDVTPTIDRLAAGGINFPKAYCCLPACVPSRISMLTGRWPDAHRVRINTQPTAAVYDKDVYQVAREQGYLTGLAGKNHTYHKQGDLDFWREYGHLDGYLAPGAPAEDAAFEEFLKSTDFNVTKKPTPFPTEAQHPYRIVSDAIDFMGQAGAKRFFLQVSFPEPHNPEQASTPYWDMFPPDKVPDRGAGPEALATIGYRSQWLHDLALDGDPALERDWRRYVSNYLGQVRMIDDQVKRLLAHMDQAGLTRNTLIVVLSDHGDYLMQYGLGRKGVGLGEALARIPMVWAGAGVRPDKARGERVHASMADVMPTLCEAMGAPIPVGVQGRSLLPVLRGAPFPEDEFRSVYATSGVGGLFYEAADHVPVKISRGTGGHWDELNKVTQSGNTKMVRMGEWKLIFDMMGNGQLYHLSTDPLELHNRFGDPGAAGPQQALMAELLMWTIRNQDNLPTGAQNDKYRTKWPAAHNWYAPYRHGAIGSPYRP